MLIIENVYKMRTEEKGKRKEKSQNYERERNPVKDVDLNESSLGSEKFKTWKAVLKSSVVLFESRLSFRITPSAC